MEQCNAISFDGQKIYCGIDVHSKNWHLCLRLNNMELKTFQVPADVARVIDWLKRTFAGAEIHSVYEAGFSGFSAHRELVSAGIHNIVINPADVPTTGKERVEKCDRTDCRKLARHLEDGSLTPIDVPSVEIENLRALIRRETQIRNDSIRAANRLKSALRMRGDYAIPKSLTEKALQTLEEDLSREGQFAFVQALLSLIRHLRWLREERKRLVAAEREAAEKLGLMESVRLLTSIHGIAFRSAILLRAELGDISRFKSRNNLAAYVGLAPHVYGSGEGEKDVASRNRKKKQLHYLLIQAAWVAVQKDPAMCAYYGHLLQKRRLKKTRAIVSVAKKMLMVVYAVLRDGKPYEPSRIFKENPAIEQIAPNSRRAAKCAEDAEKSLERLLSEEDAILALPVDLM